MVGLNKLAFLPKGQTLIEALVALALIGVVISAIAIVVVSSLNNAQFGKNQNLATKYANEAMEHLHKIRNSDYAAFRNYDGNYCFAKGQTALGASVSSCTVPNFDNFIRSVSIEQSPGCGANVAKVQVVVAWADGKCAQNSYCHKAELISCLSTTNPYL